MPAGPDLEVEGAVDLVLLRPEDGRQVLRHPDLDLDLDPEVVLKRCRSIAKFEKKLEICEELKRRMKIFLK